MPVSVTNSNKWEKKMNRLANFSTILVNIRAILSNIFWTKIYFKI